MKDLFPAVLSLRCASEVDRLPGASGEVFDGADEVAAAGGVPVIDVGGPEGGAVTVDGWNGRFLEDFAVGEVYRHPMGRTISEADKSAAFARVKTGTKLEIMGDQAKIHPVLVIFSLFLGEHTYGLVGALLAVPVLSAISVLFMYFYKKAWKDVPRPPGRGLSGPVARPPDAAPGVTPRA